MHAANATASVAVATANPNNSFFAFIDLLLVPRPAALPRPRTALSLGTRRFGRVELSGGGRQFAVFTLGDLEYAIDILSIRQIVRPQAIRRVPRAPTFVHGVIDLRGQIIPVLDLGRRFGLETDEGSRAAKLIIVQCQERLLALLVDRVLGVHRVGPEDLHPTPQWITGPEAAVFSGLCRRDGHLVLILDLSALLSLGEEVRLHALAVHPATREADLDSGLGSAEDRAPGPTPAPRDTSPAGRGDAG